MSKDNYKKALTHIEKLLWIMAISKSPQSYDFIDEAFSLDEIGKFLYQEAKKEKVSMSLAFVEYVEANHRDWMDAGE